MSTERESPCLLSVLIQLSAGPLLRKASCQLLNGPYFDPSEPRAWNTGGKLTSFGHIFGVNQNESANLLFRLSERTIEDRGFPVLDTRANRFERLGGEEMTAEA